MWKLIFVHGHLKQIRNIGLNLREYTKFSVAFQYVVNEEKGYSESVVNSIERKLS